MQPVFVLAEQIGDERIVKTDAIAAKIPVLLPKSPASEEFLFEFFKLAELTSSCTFRAVCGAIPTSSATEFGVRPGSRSKM